MAFFRSENMVYCQLVLHQETAFDCFVELGYLGKIQFVTEYDDDYVPNLKYVKEVERCGELQRTISRLQEEINKSGMKTVYYPNVDEEHVPKSDDLPIIEAAVQKLDTELTEVLRNCDSLIEKRFSVIERRQVLLKAHQFFSSEYKERHTESHDDLMNEILHDSSLAESGKAGDRFAPLNFIAGSIPKERFAAFERMIWRVSRGNAFVKYAEFQLTEEAMKYRGQTRYKHAFLVLFTGDELQTRLVKICQGFQARIYACPESENERLQALKVLENEMNDLKEVFEKTCEHKKRVLKAALPHLYIWRSKVRKINAVYFMINRLGTVRELRNQNQRYLQTECWVPKRYLGDTRAALQNGAYRAGQGDAHIIFPAILNENVNPRTKPPTYFVTNKFTYGFQVLIDSYGVASYQELNPAPYTIITFPFLFAVMFGDIGHGILITIFAFFMIHLEQKIEKNQKEATKTNEMFTLVFGGRYILILMGIFSIYTGFIYNDMLSKSLNIFGSSWHVNYTEQIALHNVLILDPSNADNYRGSPYIFGIDPVWDMSENSIIISNSIKMKVAIILGVFQMIFGLILSALNAFYLKSKVDFFLVFLPQIIFLSCLFLYLVILIFYKWTWYGGHNSMPYNPGCSPSILITFINMVLLKPPEPEQPGCNRYLYDGEHVVERVLVIIALIAVPILLCGKPFYCMYEHRKLKTIEDKEKRDTARRSTIDTIRKSLKYNIEYEDAKEVPAKVEVTKEKLSEVWIHSGIHTIESVLGSVSHTASYLRLWALSLAHSQLSLVLWKMILGKSLTLSMGYVGAVPIFFCFAFFAVLTVAILVVMEGLSAFLHTLRLHWVEFQSKFYSGEGEPFTPFRFEPSRKSDAAT